MTAVPYAIAAEQAITRQNIALSVVKQAAEQQQAIVQIIDEAARSAPVHASRGANVNISA
ncbi:hypothetical protein N9Z27_02170 [Alphaproteobacteria bacterium]|nr:hypothetical protein [Alphaproteobacteria bacterium]